MKTICANYINGIVKFTSVLTTLIIGMMFAVVSSANATVPGVNAVELIHKGNAVELIHKVKSVEPIPELIHQMKRGVEPATTVAPQKSRLNNRLNNIRELNEVFDNEELLDEL